MNTDSILSEFPPVKTEQWEHAIRETVTGLDYSAKLIWHPEEGLAVKPYYRAEDLAGLEFLDAAPGEFPFVRGTRAAGGWRIRERVDAVDPAEANRTACAAVRAGAEEIAFRRAKIASSSDAALLLADLDEIPVHLEGLSQESARIALECLRKKSPRAMVSFDLDPFADLEFSTELLDIAPPGLRPFVIQAEEFQEHAGGSIEEVGFAISAGAEFLDRMLERGASVDRAADSIAFSFAMGPDFFVQIAKLRAFRLTWAKVAESFGGNPQHAKATLHARTTTWNKTIYDPHVNILRATTETISAILGGAESISVAAFDACYKQPDESSRRLARNTQLILKQEAHLARVADPTGGSYLIEAITNSIALKAWKLFQELEDAGGFQRAIAAGSILCVLERRGQSRQDGVNHRRLCLTGTNRFANPGEKASEHLKPSCSEPQMRVASRFEALRLRTEHAERSGVRWRIVLAETGDPKMRHARSQFAADFLACAGITADMQSFESPIEIAASAAKVLVICSSDPEYMPIIEELMPKLKADGNQPHVLVAGNPDTREQLTALGVEDFIYVGSDAIEVLLKVQRQIGIED
jgi:methylmalonyl-CoA mutase